MREAARDAAVARAGVACQRFSYALVRSIRLASSLAYRTPNVSVCAWPGRSASSPPLVASPYRGWSEPGQSIEEALG
jgi:hypothetical protein